MGDSPDIKAGIAGIILLTGLAAALTYIAIGDGADVRGRSGEKHSVARRAIFTCDNAQSIAAEFFNGQTRLVLSDGRDLTVRRVRAESGGRYANPDGSFVFWDKGNTATIEENGTTTYEKCSTW